MTKVDEIMQQYNIGLAILKQFHSLNDVELKAKLRQIFATYHSTVNISLLLCEHSVVERVIRNEVVYTISIRYYDTIIINPNGITFLYEHGNQVKVVEFSETFTLEAL